MNIQLPWGDDFLDLKVPDSWGLLWPGPLSEPHHPDTVMDQSVLIEQSLNNPIAMVPLETVKPGINNVEKKFLLYYSMHLIRQYELLFRVPTLGDHEVKRLTMFKQFHDSQEVIDRAAGMMKTNSRVAVFPEAGATFPILDQNQQSEQMKHDSC